MREQNLRLEHYGVFRVLEVSIDDIVAALVILSVRQLQQLGSELFRRSH